MLKGERLSYGIIRGLLRRRDGSLTHYTNARCGKQIITKGDPVEDEIDLRPYILALLRGWYFILGATIGLALVAVLYFKYVKEPVYEARALMIPLPPLYNVVLTQQIVTNESLPQRSYQVLPELAEADQVMMLLLEEVQSLPNASTTDEITLAKLRSMTDVVVQGTSLTSMRFVVEHADPEMAAQIANLWADVFISEVNRIYGEGQDEISFLEAELVSADAQRAVAEQAVIDFEGQDASKFMREKLQVLTDDYARISTEQTSMDRLIRDIASLRSQLELQANEQVISLGDELSVMSMQFRLYNASSSNYQLELSLSPEFSGKTAGDAIDLLDGLSQIAEEKLLVLGNQLINLETEILTLQQSIEATSTQKIRLSDDRALTISLYTVLSTKLTESRITTQENLVSYITVGSYAAVPSKPQSQSLPMLIAIGGGAGFFLSAAVLAGLEYLRLLKPQDRLDLQRQPVSPEK